MKKFNVLIYNFNNKKVESYDIIPYFKHKWNKDKKKCKKDDTFNFKDWVINTSRYQFWARCEYEFLIAPWPYTDLEVEIIKIDVHEQIMMNIDLIVDILKEEFKIK
jgi:hypothetical protein